MIFGKVIVGEEAVSTHRDSYLLSQLSVVSVRRPFLSSALLFAIGLSGFAMGFRDLLYPTELGFIAVGVTVSLVVGWTVGQLKLLSRDLRGTELCGVIWGSFGALNQVRHQIVTALSRERGHAL
ncbi:MAG: hypothetical protein ROR55_02935 [Devosia sp.]